MCDDIYADGTFKCCPSIFSQLYTFHGLKYNVSIPLIYALLPNKSMSTYKHLLSKIKDLVPEMNPRSILTDFEKAMIASFNIIFPNAAHRGCFFHFTQCIWRKIQSLGLASRYSEDYIFASNLRLLAALAFVPSNNVIEYYEFLCDEVAFGEEVTPLLDYFEDIFIGRPLRVGGRRDPLFSIEMWNVFESKRIIQSRVGTEDLMKH